MAPRSDKESALYDAHMRIRNAQNDVERFRANYDRAIGESVSYNTCLANYEIAIEFKRPIDERSARQVEHARQNVDRTSREMRDNYDRLMDAMTEHAKAVNKLRELVNS